MAASLATDADEAEERSARQAVADLAMDVYPSRGDLAPTTAADDGGDESRPAERWFRQQSDRQLFTHLRVAHGMGYESLVDIGIDELARRLRNVSIDAARSITNVADDQTLEQHQQLRRDNDWPARPLAVRNKD